MTAHKTPASQPVFIQPTDPLLADPALDDGAIWVNTNGSNVVEILSVLQQGQWGTLQVGDGSAGGSYVTLTSYGITWLDGGASRTRFAATGDGFMTSYNTAPNSLFMPNSTVALWLDDTPGATKLMIKAKDSNGNVRNAALNLT